MSLSITLNTKQDIKKSSKNMKQEIEILWRLLEAKEAALKKLAVFFYKRKKDSRSLLV